MNSYIKHIVEAFDFNSVNKQKKAINAADIIKDILRKIQERRDLSDVEYSILKTCIGIYEVSDNDELKLVIKYFINLFGNYCNLNWINVSKVRSMDSLFNETEFNGDISEWDVSSVKYMDHMFYNSVFNGNISNWNVSNVQDMTAMFQFSKFNGNISNWNVSNVTNMQYMFYGTEFNKDISNWDVSNVTNMSRMFYRSSFNSDISKWNVSNVTNMEAMFWLSDFLGELSDWNVSKVTNMSEMFSYTKFNGDISQWNVSNVTNMSRMFSSSQFNQDISNWDVSNVTDMDGMFSFSHFNQDISKWDVSKVKNILYTDMFKKCPIRDWYKPNITIVLRESFDFDTVNKQKKNINASEVLLNFVILRIDNREDLEEDDLDILILHPGIYKVYDRAELKELIDYFMGYYGPWSNFNWIDVSNITDMYAMFNNSDFNGDISLWDVSNVEDMSYMFSNSDFNGDISNWNISKVLNMNGMFQKSEFNGDISNWNINSNCIIKDIFKNSSIKEEYKIKKAVRIAEGFDFDNVNKKRKSINGADILLDYIIHRIDNREKLTYDDYDILVLYTGIYKVKDKDELKDLILYFMNLFGNEVNLNWIDVSDITDMSYLFEETEFNGDISKWNVSNVTNMSGMFWNTKFNGDISNWDVSKVLDMNHMFSISPFNGDISRWNVSNVKDIRRMFNDATEFNQDISNWDLKSVTDARNMFRNCNIKEEYKPKKIKINESFNFSSVNKSKKSTNIYSKFYEILGKSYSEITEEDKDFINFFPDCIYKAQDKDELKKIIKRTIRLLGYDCNLNWIDVSNITDMSNLFLNSKFNGDISRWDVSNVTDMKEMFWRSEFDGDISRWDVSNVTNMQGMFMNSLFNGDINNWDVSHVIRMDCMFHNTGFNNDISHWDVSNVIYMSGMFDNASFNKDISNWKINPNCKIDFIFADCPIKELYKPKKKNIKIHESFEFDKVNKRKKQINYYELLLNIIEKIKQFKNLTDNDYNILTQYNAIYKVSERDKLVALIDYFTELFGNECNLNWIDVSNITDMSRLFMQSSFNGDISKWDVSNVTDMSQIFDSCPFSGDISLWDVSNVTTMEMMFFYSGFNNDISHWDVSNVTECSGIFTECPIEELYKPKKFRL